MADRDGTPARARWARLRFSIIGPLLAAPPELGELGVQLRELAQKTYRHPTTGAPLHFSVSTLERWYYACRLQSDPVRALERRVPRHAGTHPAVSAGLARAVATLYREHPGWTAQLHYDNLVTLAREDASIGPMPSYPTVRRHLKHQGLNRQRRRRHAESTSDATSRAPREVRSYEMTHVHALWHLDFHVGSRKVLCPSGEWKTPMLLGVVDDYSRIACHLQWYLDETAESLVHGLSQALQKRGLPRALMTDNGSAMLAAETTEGLERLGILHETTLPYSPEQNAKQENFWARIEGRLKAMLEGEPQVTLALLNEATQDWAEQEYPRQRHSELDATPLERLLGGPSVVRPCCPELDVLRRAFRTEVKRLQRRSDGTITVEGVRFEVPSRYRALAQLSVRVARWDLSTCDLVDARTGTHLCVLLPLDKHKNADGARRVIAQAAVTPSPEPSGIAPRLRVLMAEYAATGLPPAYLPKHDAHDDSNTDEEDSK